MRKSPHLIALVALSASLFSGGPGSARERESPDPDLYDAYRVDALGPVPAAVPDEIRLLPSAGARAWPEVLRAELVREIRTAWDPETVYGAVHSSLGIWVEYPLVTARIAGRVLVPVVSEEQLKIAGQLELPHSRGPRRVVVLVDASASSNAETAFGGANGLESTPVLEAERRALDHLVHLLGDEWLEFGIIAFGEGTWPIAEPGATLVDLKRALALFRSEHPRGSGRTDAVCALWTAHDWLADAPSGVEREIILLTDGDLPHSGRFVDCSIARRQRGKRAEAACEARRNRTACPATKRFSLGHGRSDLKQLAHFAKRTRRDLAVTPLVFEWDRRATLYERLARDTGGRFVRVPSPEAIEVALPALVGRRIRRVIARNATTGEQTGDLRDGPDGHFSGGLGLRRGPNDVELRVESDRGLASLLRFRIHHEPDVLSRYLAGIRDRNAALAAEMEGLVDAARSAQPRPKGGLELEVVREAPVPAAPAD